MVLQIEKPCNIIWNKDRNNILGVSLFLHRQDFRLFWSYCIYIVPTFSYFSINQLSMRKFTIMAFCLIFLAHNVKINDNDQNHMWPKIEIRARSSSISGCKIIDPVQHIYKELFGKWSNRTRKKNWNNKMWILRKEERKE